MEKAGNQAVQEKMAKYNSGKNIEHQETPILEKTFRKKLRSEGAGKNWRNTILGKNILEKH